MMRKTIILSLVVVGIMALAGGATALDGSRAFLWDGTNWQQVSNEAKIGYIFGIGNLADFETTAARGHKSPCISSAFVNDLRSRTVSQIVEEVDRFYQENPQKLTTSVIEVVLRRCTTVCPPETPVRK